MRKKFTWSKDYGQFIQSKEKIFIIILCFIYFFFAKYIQLFKLNKKFLKHKIFTFKRLHFKYFIYIDFESLINQLIIYIIKIYCIFSRV